MKGWFSILGIVVAGCLLSGCLYPQEKKVENKVPYEEQIASVQQAVIKFQEASGGLLPIKTREMDTPLYQKYPIDFSQLYPKYMESPPGNAYESGGVFQYVLIDVEDQPTVKVFDLRIAEKISQIQIRIQAQGYPPFKDHIAGDLYTLDQKKIGYKEEQFITSPYTQNNLPLMVDGKGNIYVDYISDIYQALQKEKKTYKNGDDIRGILLKESSIVPAFSVPYTVDENNEPVYMVK